MKKTLRHSALPLSIVLFFFLLAPLVTQAQKESADKSKEISPEKLQELLNQSNQEATKILKELKFQTGEVKLKDGLATIKLPENFKYLDPKDGKKVLVDLWGNPPEKSNDTLGLIVPADFKGVGADAWAVVITYSEDGYVKDDEAEKINYDDMLKEMKESEKEENAERAKAGYESIEIVGWAAKPRYDKATHKLYWAREFKFGQESEHTLNYDIRALGRHGVLSLNAVAAMGQLKTVEKDMQQVLSFVEFNQGHRYEDFKPGVDKVAAYGIGALVAGKLLAKAGLFKLLLGFLVAGKKFIFIALLAVGGIIKKLFSRKSAEQETISATEGQ